MVLGCRFSGCCLQTSPQLGFHKEWREQQFLCHSRRVKITSCCHIEQKDQETAWKSYHFIVLRSAFGNEDMRIWNCFLRFAFFSNPSSVESLILREIVSPSERRSEIPRWNFVWFAETFLFCSPPFHCQSTLLDVKIKFRHLIVMASVRGGDDALRYSTLGFPLTIDVHRTR